MKYKLKNTKITVIYFIILLYLEICFKIINNDFLFNISSLYNIFFCLFMSVTLSFLTYLFNSSFNKIVFYLITFLLGFLYSLELCIYKIFGFYFNFSLLWATDQVADFAGDAMRLILKNSGSILLFFLPFIILLIMHNFIKIPHKEIKVNTLYLFLSVLLFLGYNLSLNIKKGEEYELYHHVNNTELMMKRLGVVNAFFLDLERTIMGFDEEILITEKQDNEEKEKEEDKPVEIVYDYNNLDYNFEELINASNSSELTKMHNYFKNEAGTLQNEYTNYFKDKNLILFMAESFNEIAVSEELTPTLYKLINNGFYFPNFYTPTISSTIGGEFQELTGLVAASGFLKPWKKGENSFPFGIATVFQKMGYNTYAYHDHNYSFQSRNKYLKALGFTNFTGCKNGLEEKINCNIWPESDVEMIDATVNDYLTSDKPFFTYYVTVSGHGDYGFKNTAMGRKHKEEVAGLNYSEKVLSYIAAQIELDKALENLLNYLTNANKLDNTVIALVGDHYPYYLSLDEVNEASSYEKDSVVEINHSNFILWNNKMPKITVDKVGSQIDVLPTLYNLFGVKYDSRLLIGKDILSTEPGLAIFGNRSWVSDYGTYFASSKKFVPKENVNVSEDYVQNMNKIVANKMNMSGLILENDYYKYFTEGE